MGAPVLLAGQQQTLTLGRTAYTIRALTYGEMSSLLIEEGTAQVYQAEILEAQAEALRAQGREDLAAALEARADAQDALSALLAARPSTLDDEGVRRWEADHAEELQRLRRDAVGRERLIGMAQAKSGRDPAVVALLRRNQEAMTFRTLTMLRACVLAIDGVPMPEGWDPADLPVAHVGPLARAVQTMQAPVEDAAKN